MKAFRKELIGLILLVVVFVIAKNQLQQQSRQSGQETIYFYNWGDYIDPTVLADFEAETGYQVVYDTFDSNEAMMTKIQQGGTAYDVVVPSEYTVNAMIEKDLLVPLDRAQLTQWEQTDPRFMDQPFDPGNQYSVPYFWGTLGILYNQRDINAQDIQHWNDLWRDDFRNEILMFDGAREVLGIGLQSMGYSLNETDSDRLAQATQKMNTLMPNIRALVADEIKLYMVQEESKLAITFSGEAAMAMEKNENLAYYVPEEGSNLWFDCLVIPTTAQNLTGAHALIDFLLRPDIAARNAEYVGYATPNRQAVDLLDPAISSDSTFYPSDELISHLEVYENLGQDKLIEYNDLFLDIKLSNR